MSPRRASILLPWNHDVNPERLRQAPNIAIVGSSSPIGKELRETLDSAVFPVGRLSLVETEEYAGLLQEFAGEIRITQIISPETFQDIDIAFFACSPEIIGAYAASGSAFPDLTIDLTQTGREGILFLRGVSDASLLQGPGYYINPHPATIALGRVLARIRSAFHLESLSITILDPASERGLAGVNELQEQTVELLNFQPVESKMFGGQLAFNLLAEIETARRTETLVRQQLSKVLGEGLPPIGIAAIQAPVFHSHAFSVFLELKEKPTAEEIAASLREGSGVTVHGEGGLSPSPVTVVGSDVVHVVRVASDPAQQGSCFLWVVSDNLRIAASNALQMAESLMLAPASPH
jgi:aspartate-semialdehyde dehydrogenase